MVLALTAGLLGSGAAPIGRVDIDVGQMRSGKGLILVCVTADPGNFPRCVDDTRAIRRRVPASAPSFSFDGLPLGKYAVAVIHDENGNRRLDTLAGIPREGYGFSRNAAVRFGPPRFDDARFALDGVTERQQIRMRYIL